MSTVKSIACWLLRLEVPILLALYLYFILTDALPLIGAVFIFSVYAVRVWLMRRVSASTLFDIPIIFLLILLPFNLLISPSWALSLPKVFGLIFGIAFFYAIVNHLSTQHDLSLAIVLLAALGFAISLAGLIGTDWAQGKIITASFVYERLPRFIQGIPRSIAGGFARNGIGGTLTFTIPLLAALTLAGASSQPLRDRDLKSVVTGTQPLDMSNQVAGVLLRQSRYIAPFALALSIVTLALTQSRGGILGALVGVAALILWKKPKVAIGLVTTGLLLLIAVVALGRGSILASAVSDGTLASRMEVWQRGWMMVEDFPLTGIGLGTYNVVAHTLYPFFIASPDEIVPHAHNQLLEVAVDLGVPGFLLYVALLGGFFACAWRAYRSLDDLWARALIVGLVSGMLAHHVFGLTDAFILGTKPGLLMWIYFGIVAALSSHPHLLMMRQGRGKSLA